jgi:hypothetical protein
MEISRHKIGSPKFGGANIKNNQDSIFANLKILEPILRNISRFKIKGLQPFKTFLNTFIE